MSEHEINWATVEATLTATYYRDLRELEVSSSDEVLFRVSELDEHMAHQSLIDMLGLVGDNMHIDFCDDAG